MWIVIGLGNPGWEYERSRHNLGFAVVDALAASTGIRLVPGAGEYHAGSGRSGGDEVVLVKPTTYMNNSGVAVREILERLKAGLDRILVVVDDFNLPLGSLRLRKRGSPGGHNGLYSIVYQLQSEEFARLRCGIAGSTMPAEKRKLASYVLAPFERDEESAVDSLVLAARDAVLAVVREGLDAAISRFNRVAAPITLSRSS